MAIWHTFRDEFPVTGGYICSKVRHFDRRIYGEDRLHFPAVRVGAKGEGRFRRVSWNDALDTIATTFAEIRGRLAAADLRGVGVLAHRLCGSAGNLGAQDLAQRLRAIEEACRTPGAAAPGEAEVVGLERSFAAADAFFRAQLDVMTR